MRRTRSNDTSSRFGYQCSKYSVDAHVYDELIEFTFRENVVVVVVGVSL